MSLKIRIPKLVEPSSNSEVAMGSVKKRVGRRVAEYSDDEDYEIGRGEGSGDDVVMPKSSKRIRHQDRNFAHEGADSDVDAEGEVDIEGIEDDTRFLPDAIQPETKATSRLSKSKHRPEAPLPSASKKRSSGKVKRAVVYSDDEDEDEYGARGEQMDDGDDFELDPAPKRSGLMNTGRGRGSGARISKMKVEKEITIKDERKPLSIPAVAPAASSYGAKRTRMKEEEDVTGVPHSATINEEIPSLVKEPDPTPPPTKKRKLPPIKKNKSTTGSAASSTPTTKPPVKLPLDKKDDISLVRKPAGSTNNADFDLRDASVYASLFTKPSGATPNSGLNRKEKEEERKKELHKMRDDARAKRAEEARHTFDLQAAHDKIQRFEEKLHQRKSLAMYPNILGASFKEAHDKTRRSRWT